MNRRNSEPPAFREKPESASSESHHASTSHSSSSGLSRALPGPAVVSAGIFIASGLVCDSLQAQLSADRDVLIPAFLRPSLGFLATALLSVLGPLLAARLNRTGSLDWLGNGSLTPPRKHYVALAVVLVAAQILWAIAFSSVPLYILQSLSVSSGAFVLLLSTFLSIALPSSIIQVAALTSACLVGFALQGTESDHWAVFAGASGLFLQVLALHLIKTELASHSSSSVISSIAPYAALIGLITTLLSHFSLSLDHAQTLQYVQSPHTALYVVFSAAHNIALIHLLNHVDHILTITFLFLFKALVALAGSQQLWDGDPVARSLGFAIIFSFGIVVSLAKTKAQSLPLPNLPEPLFSNSNNDVTTSPSISSRHKHVKQLRWAVAAALAPFCCWLLLDPSQPSLSTVSIPQNDLLAFNDTSSLDVVMAYYNEPIDSIIEQMQHLRSIPHIAQRNPTFITYVKGDNVSLSEYKQATGMDEVYRLPNVGREGDTYLQHILRNYNATIEPVLQSLDRDDVGGYLQPRGLAFQTFFLQVHMSWHWIAKPRCHLLQHDTGYLALGPYIRMNCGKDLEGNGDYWRQRDIYMVFEEKFCPPDKPQLSNYAAQFVASRERILSRASNKYQFLIDMMGAPMDHWIHQDAAWWHYNGDQTPSNPFLGHALERSWATIMGCLDGSIAEQCGDDVFDSELCQCFDR